MVLPIVKSGPLGYRTAQRKGPCHASRGWATSFFLCRRKDNRLHRYGEPDQEGS